MRCCGPPDRRPPKRHEAYLPVSAQSRSWSAGDAQQQYLELAQDARPGFLQARMPTGPMQVRMQCQDPADPSDRLQRIAQKLTSVFTRTEQAPLLESPLEPPMVMAYRYGALQSPLCTLQKRTSTAASTTCAPRSIMARRCQIACGCSCFIAFLLCHKLLRPDAPFAPALRRLIWHALLTLTMPIRIAVLHFRRCLLVRVAELPCTRPGGVK